MESDFAHRLKEAEEKFEVEKEQNYCLSKKIEVVE